MNYLISFYNISYPLKPKNFSNDKTKILDPLNTVIKLALLGFKAPNTKLSITNHNVFLHEPSYFQGAIRIYNGDNKEDLHYLLNPLYLATIKYLNDSNLLLFTLAINGLNLLKETYNCSETTKHTIDLYIYMLDNSINKKNVEFSFIKISSEDIDLYSKFYYNWRDEEINVIITLFNLIKKSPTSFKNSYIGSIEKILCPIDDTIKEISYI
jgi:hypothetical protein